MGSNRRRLALSTATFVALAIVVPRAAQQSQSPPAEPAPTFRSGVDVTTIDVSVLDKHRHPVRGLTRADFTIVEDGKVQPIVGFRTVEIPGPAAFSASWMREVAPDVVTNRVDAERVIVMFLDDWSLSLDSFETQGARTIGHTIIDELGPLDMAAVVYAVNGGNGQELTNDRQALHRAIDRYYSAMQPTMGMGSTMSVICWRYDCVMDAFKNVGRILSGWPGKRKIVAYVSPPEGFQVGSPNVEMGAFESNVNAWSNGWDLQTIFKELHAANVNVYRFHPTLFIGPQIGIMAENTGGRSWWGIAPWEHVPDMFDENDVYYVLAYQSSQGYADGKIRDVGVRVARKDVTVRTSDGYTAPSAKQAAKAAKKPPVPTLEKAMGGALPDGELPMSLSVVPFAMPGRSEAAVAIVAGLDRAADLPGRDTVDLAARAYDVNRKSNGAATAKLELTHRERPTGVVHYDIPTRLDLKPGRYEIRLAATSPAAGLTGSAYASIDVPDFSKDPLSVSGVVLGRVPLRRPSGRDTLNGLLPFLPTTTRAFGRGEPITAYLRVYQGGKTPLTSVTISARLIDTSDRAVFEELRTLPPSSFSSSTRAADYRLDPPAARLESGEFLLRIEAESVGGLQRRDVRFKVE